MNYMRQQQTAIIERLKADLFDTPLLQNNLRGIYCEYMVAEALGPACRIVSHSWNAWDLEFGDTKTTFPNRIRIQVKNSARLQTWQKDTALRTSCQWTLAQRKKPEYFDANNPGIPCEDYGFLCEVFILCHHPEGDEAIADQRDPGQWRFYTVPVTPNTTAYKLHVPADPNDTMRRSYTLVPESIARGIRNRPKLTPLRFEELTETYVRNCFAPDRLVG